MNAVPGPIESSTRGTDSGLVDISDPRVPSVPLAEEGAGPSLYRGSTNSMVLHGPIIGSGTIPNSDIIREIPIVAEDFGNGLLVRSLSLVTFIDDVFADFLAVIENTSNRLVCTNYIPESQIFRLNGADRVARPRDFVSFEIWGSNARLRDRNGSLIDYASDCVLPGAIVYGYGRFAVATANEIDSASIGGVEGSFDYTPYETNLEAVSYSVRDDGNVDVLLANRTDRTVNVGAVHLVLLDENGAPVGGLSGVGRYMDPGEERTVLMIGSVFPGQVSTVRVIVEYKHVRGL